MTVGTTTTSRSSPCSNPKLNSKRVYPFVEARRIARQHGFESKEEFLDYNCPGAYQLPKDPQNLYAAEWKGWDDFLGITIRNFAEAREVARQLELPTQSDYLVLWETNQVRDDHPAARLPYRPDLHFKAEWIDWNDWLGRDP